jgi:hypothetical protein
MGKSAPNASKNINYLQTPKLAFPAKPTQPIFVRIVMAQNVSNVKITTYPMD